MADATMSDATSSLLNRSLDDIIAESRTASKKAPAGKARTDRKPRSERPAAAASTAETSATPADPTVIRVNNLAWTVTQDALLAFMGSAGTVLKAEIPVNAAGKSKGHARVQFESVEAALKAVETLNDVELEGRKVALRQDKGKAAVPAKTSTKPAARAATADSQAGNVYIGNLAYSVTSDELTNHLRTVGKVASVSMSNGWAVARYATAKGASAAIAKLTDTELRGRKIFVREDREPAAAGAGGLSRARTGAGTVTVVKPVTGPAATVSGLPLDITSDELRGIFASVGATHASVSGRGVGVVGFRAAGQADRAVAEFNGALVNGRAISVRVK